MAMKQLLQFKITINQYIFFWQNDIMEILIQDRQVVVDIKGYFTICLEGSGYQVVRRSIIIYFYSEKYEPMNTSK